jgi:hypothetical protein
MKKEADWTHMAHRNVKSCLKLEARIRFSLDPSGEAVETGQTDLI